MNKADGCLEYTETIVSIYFPKDNVCCQLCPLLGGTERRPQCNRSGEYIVDTRGRGLWCKLGFVQEEEE